MTEHRGDEAGGFSEAVRAAHDDATAHGEPNYVDPQSGFLVFTAQYLLARGRCCGSGCRHCPFDDEARCVAGRPA
jgi:hypothetical protein